jgi:carboxymethylenebutenolidase
LDRIGIGLPLFSLAAVEAAPSCRRRQMYDGTLAESIWITGAGGDRIEGYFARPLGPGPYGSVVVIHHLPGYDDSTKEITRRFAAMGYLALCPNLYTREAPRASPDDAAAVARANGGVPDERLVGDVAGAASFLRELSYANGRVATIGYCSGGRQSFLAATSLELEAAVVCYGAFIVGDPPATSSMKATPLVDRAPLLSCPVLGLFGADDSYPSPEQVAVLDAALNDAGKEHEFHSFEGAGHAFFSVDRPSYRPEAANEGWRLIDDFFTRHLA